MRNEVQSRSPVLAVVTRHPVKSITASTGVAPNRDRACPRGAFLVFSVSNLARQPGVRRLTGTVSPGPSVRWGDCADELLLTIGRAHLPQTCERTTHSPLTHRMTGPRIPGAT